MLFERWVSGQIRRTKEVILLPSYSELDEKQWQLVLDFRRDHWLKPVEPEMWQQLTRAEYEHVFVTAPAIEESLVQDPYNDDCHGGIGIATGYGLALLVVLGALVRAPVVTVEFLAALGILIIVVKLVYGRSRGRHLFI
jgi:hypothetical protein